MNTIKALIEAWNEFRRLAESDDSPVKKWKSIIDLAAASDDAMPAIIEQEEKYQELVGLCRKVLDEKNRIRVADYMTRIREIVGDV